MTKETITQFHTVYNDNGKGVTIATHKTWREQEIKNRLVELLEASHKCKNLNISVPKDWVDEYYKLYFNLHKIKCKKEFHVYSH